MCWLFIDQITRLYDEGSPITLDVWTSLHMVPTVVFKVACLHAGVPLPYLLHSLLCAAQKL